MSDIYINVSAELGPKTIAITSKSTWGDLKASYNRPYAMYNTVVIINGEKFEHSNSDVINLPNGSNVRLRFLIVCADCGRSFQSDLMFKHCADCRI
jgi:hypothetical protein